MREKRKQAMYNEAGTDKQTGENDTPVVSIWVNAKGKYQYSIRLNYASNAELLEKSVDDLLEFDLKIRNKFPLAGSGE
jgi:hypothetical protein